MTEVELKKELLGNLIRSTRPSWSAGNSIGLVTKIELVKAREEDGVEDEIYIWSVWPNHWFNEGWGKGVYCHTLLMFKKAFEVI